MCDEIWNAASALRNAAYPVRWVPRDNIHLTLKFLGEVDERRLDAISGCLHGCLERLNQFDLALEDFGVFPTARDPRVVWLGCYGPPPLELAVDAMERRFQELGFPLEKRAFRPHVTLGRVRRNAGRHQLTSLAADVAAGRFATSAVVESIDLMESRLGGQGPQYSIRERAALPSR